MSASKDRYQALCLLLLVGILIAPTLARAVEALPTQDAHTAGVVAEITEAKRTQGLLSVKIRLRNTSSQEARIEIIGYKGKYHQYYVVAGQKWEEGTEECRRKFSAGSPFVAGDFPTSVITTGTIQ